jgi:hypothetical protein
MPAGPFVLLGSGFSGPLVISGATVRERGAYPFDGRRWLFVPSSGGFGTPPTGLTR